MMAMLPQSNLSSDRFLVVDGNNLAMRAIHATAHGMVMSADGVNTAPLVVFVNSLTKHIREIDPNYVVVCWDSGKSTYRLGLCATYKSNRTEAGLDSMYKRDSFALIKEFLALCNVPQIERSGIEADDLIAAYRLNWIMEKGLPFTILSSDKDFLQLLGENVNQIRLSSYGTPTDVWTEDRVLEEFKCRPDQLPLAMAIAGDDSDGVIGVPRFGMKTAIKALAKVDWDLDRLFEENEKIHPHAEEVVLNLKLVDLRGSEFVRSLAQNSIAAPPEFSPTKVGDGLFAELQKLLQRYELQAITSRLYAGNLWTAGLTDTPLRS